MTPLGIIELGTVLYHVPREAMYVGMPVVVHKQGRYRRASVARLGPKQVRVAWATSGSDRREQAIPYEHVFETNDGSLHGGEAAGRVATMYEARPDYYGPRSKGHTLVS